MRPPVAEVRMVHIYMDAINLKQSELEALKNDLLTFIHRVSGMNDKTDAEVAVLPAIASLLLQHTGIIRLKDEQLQTVINALHQANYMMSTDNGLIVTDLPEAQNETTWQLDYSETQKAINEAICILDMSVYNRKNDCPEHTA